MHVVAETICPRQTHATNTDIDMNTNTDIGAGDNAHTHTHTHIHTHTHTLTDAIEVSGGFQEMISAEE